MSYVPNVWQSAFIYNENVQATDDKISESIGRLFPKIKQNKDMFVVSFDNTFKYSMNLHEEMTMADFFPVLPDIRVNNIGDCLYKWNIGIVEEIVNINDIPTFIGVIINTNKHMYIFEMVPNSIYCRAARFVATNKGVIFNQNFRQGLNAYMIEDNREAGLPLEYDEALFTSNACIWNSRSVYWSVNKYDDMFIELNGCQNDVYYWRKPKR